MNLNLFLKRISPLVVVFVLFVAIFNFGSYDPYNELTVLSPQSAEATVAVSTAGALSTSAIGTTPLTVTAPSIPTAPTVTAPTVSTPVVTAPTTALSVPGLSIPGLSVPELSVPAIPTTSTSVSFATCEVNASSKIITTGSSVTLSWNTQGFAAATLNGASVDVSSGAKTFANVQANTTYTLVATSADGSSNCTSTVTVTCIPPATAPTCSTLGYDFTAAKFSWNGSFYVKESSHPDYQISVAGDNIKADWTSNKAVTAVIAQTDYSSKVYTGGLSGTIQKCDIGSGCNKITKIQFCGNNEVVPAPTCQLTPATQTISSGSSVNLNWTTTNAASATLTSFGNVALSGSQNTGALTSNTSYTLAVVGTNGDSISCNSTIIVPPVTTKFCELSLDKSVSTTSAKFGDEITYTIKIKNVGTADCTGGGVKIEDIHDTNLTYVWETHTSNLDGGYGSNSVYTPSTRTLRWNGNTLTPGEEGTMVWIGKVNNDLACNETVIVKNTAKATAKELNNFQNWVYSNTVETLVTSNKICTDPLPKCDAFTASPTTIDKGDSATLSWATTNVTSVAINNGIGGVSSTGTLSVTPLETTEYILTAFGLNNKKDTCTATVTVVPPTVNKVPKCETFTASPTSLPAGGGNVNLNWTTTNATGVTILPSIGAVALNGSTTVGITNTQTFTLTAVDSDGDKDVCTVTVPVTPVTTSLSCAANVNFSASDSSISRGNSSTLNWTTTGITGVSFDNGITATGLSGSTSVSPSNTTTYNLTATNGSETISCPVTISVTTGGGGSSSPRCELEASDNKISSGEDVVLTWGSSLATDLVMINETTGKTIVTTEGLLSNDKKDLFDGKITVNPKTDTTYELTVSRGSKTRTCTVDIDVEDNVVVTQVRDQQPLVTSISLTQVPYTGFEAGPILTLLFYVLLMAWALYMAYLLVIRKDVIGGISLASMTPATVSSNSSRIVTDSVQSHMVTASTAAPAAPAATVPVNLPVAPVVGYSNVVSEEVVEEVSKNIHNINDVDMTTIENLAHARRVLLSSDAIRHFIATTNTVGERTEALEQVIQAAKAQYPAEDGWIVLNEKRMQDLCLVCAANSTHSSETPYIPAVIPEGAGSLAEAIVTGNIVAAYELIGSRPMFALADASADLDAVYRIRRGGKAVASELLMKETANLTDEQIFQMIEALTGALDGVYTDEASAVKMSIMKAVKVAA